MSKFNYILKQNRNSFRLGYIFFYVLLYSSNLHAQTPVDPPTDDATEQKIEKIAEEAGEDVDANTLLDKLNYYREHKINLNHTSREELKDLLLLNDIQVEAIFTHILTEGDFLAIQEIQTIDELDPESILRILPFVKVDNAGVFEKFSLRKIFTEGKNSLLIRDQQVLEEQPGYENQNDSTYNANKSYAGSQQKLYAKYRFTSGNRVSIGFTAEKDAGEEFFKGTQKFDPYRGQLSSINKVIEGPQQPGFDYYSAHLFIRGNGFIRTIALGDFQTQYGQGVVLWSGLAFGKSIDILNLKRNARGILPYTSSDENFFMRGGAIAFGYKKFQLDVFYSRHKIDGHVVNSTDTLTVEDIISAFQTGGYHRTSSEYRDRHTITESHTGGHLSYKSNNLTVGVTALTTKFSLYRFPVPFGYNKFDFSGDHNFNSGVDISYLYRNVSLFGEAGRSMNGAIGYLGGALIALDPRFSLSLLHRHFDKDYHALLSNAISENSKDANETGTMVGISAKPVRAIQVNAYYDVFSFPWLKYQVDAPSKGYEYVAQVNFTPGKTFDTYFRIKQQNKPENFPGIDVPVNGLQDVIQTNYRFNLKYKITKAFTLSNRIEYVTLNKKSTGTQKGYMMYQDISYKPMKSKVSLSLRYVLFDTESYDTRIYVYENDVLYAYSIPSYYYKGSKYYLLIHYSIVRGIDCWFRIGRIAYDNQQTVGSGLDLIDGPHKTEIKAQIRFQF
ncbi:MAG: hypothetical protein ABI763_15485 [Bacteroidota bacterium]